ncbi:MAG: AMP-binding protein [Verrucomicrobiae bacterium]|nr:AMP-binding protein [Verrucomicrobiae bacterium]
MSLTLPALLDGEAAGRPEATFLVDAASGRETSFAGVRQDAQQLATWMYRAGARRGDRILIAVEEPQAVVRLLLGAWSGGLVPVPLDPRGGAGFHGHVRALTEAPLHIISPSLLPDWIAGTSGARVVTTDQIPEASHEASVARPSSGYPFPDDDALLIFTSGSTGTPRGVLLTHAGLVASAANGRNAHDLRPEDRSLCVLPWHHLNAITITLLPTLCSGGSVVLCPGFRLERFWQWMSEFGCTWSALVPAIVAQLMDWQDPQAPDPQRGSAAIRFLRSSSAPLRPALQQSFEERFGIPLIQAMGSTEAGGVILSQPMPPETRRLGSPGRAVGFEMRIVRGECPNAEPDEPGALLIRGPSVMRGYFRDPQATAEVLDAEGWLDTGDLAWRDADGFIHIAGRSRDLIIKGGINIAPPAVDEALQSHPDVAEVAAVGVPDPHWGEDIVAFVRLRAGATTDSGSLRTHCARLIGELRTPSLILAVDDLPRTATGKVQRSRLADHFRERLAQARATDPTRAPARPGDSVEPFLARAWEDAIGRRPENPEDNFFAFGGHSLPAQQVIHRIHRGLGVVLTLAEFLRHPTLRGQSALIRTRLDVSTVSSGSSVASARGETEVALTPMQEGIWIHSQTMANPVAYHEAEAVRLLGALDPGVLRHALVAVVRRHAALRTVIRFGGQGPVQLALDDWTPALGVHSLRGVALNRRDAAAAALLDAAIRAPFDLETTPGIRALLIQHSDEDSVLLLVLHHLICDRTSIGILTGELSAAYRAILGGTVPAYGSPTRSFLEWASGWRTAEAQVRTESDSQHWARLLQGVAEVPDLPTDCERPSKFTGEADRLTGTLGPGRYGRLRSFAQNQCVSPFTVLLAVWGLQLAGLSGCRDLCIGVPVSGRERPETESLFGVVAGLVPFRLKLDPAAAIPTFIQRVHRDLLNAMDHAQGSLARIVALRGARQDPSRCGLVPFSVNWKPKSSRLRSLDLDGVRTREVPLPAVATKFEFLHSWSDLGQDLELEADFYAALYSRATEARWLAGFLGALDRVTEPGGDGLRCDTLLPG